ncbi:hypothetical protein JTE90_019490 [Oedothorax gibbosus]|uniref:BZIP domain-containing protein n=1 Tax=Oedothorax gibbosus TaxID=931172 RepID=A0AAV6UJ72_9ARAC|nr:hypothetical protein JTE90_019490 [Oedothorax gibbosus]
MPILSWAANPKRKFPSKVKSLPTAKTKETNEERRKRLNREKNARFRQRQRDLAAFSITAPLSVHSPVESEQSPTESFEERRKRLNRERSARYRERKRAAAAQLEIPTAQLENYYSNVYF